MDTIKTEHLCVFGRKCYKETCPLFHPRWANDRRYCVYCIKEEGCWEHGDRKLTLGHVKEQTEWRTHLWLDIFTGDYYSVPKPEPQPAATPIETVSAPITKKQKRPIEMQRFCDEFADQESDSECTHN